MQPHTQIRSGATQLACLFAPGRVHKQAGAGENAALMRFENAAVDTATRAEVIAIDDQVFHGETSLLATLSRFPKAVSRANSSCLTSALARVCAARRRSERTTGM